MSVLLCREDVIWYVEQSMEEQEYIDEQMDLWVTVGHPKSKCV